MGYFDYLPQAIGFIFSPLVTLIALAVGALWLTFTIHERASDYYRGIRLGYRSPLAKVAAIALVLLAWVLYLNHFIWTVKIAESGLQW